MESFSDLHRVCLSVFDSVARTTSVFILPLFVGRIVFSNILAEGSKAFVTLKSTVIYFCLIAGFPIIMEILFSIPDTYLPRFQSLSGFMENSPESIESMIPFTLDRILEVLIASLYWLAFYLHIFFMLMMCSMAPVVFLTSTLLGVGLGLEIFLGLLIAGSSWPIIWFGFDQVHTTLAESQIDAFGAKCLELLLTLFKGLSPIAFATVAIKSPAGQVIARATHGAIGVGKWSTIKAVRAPSTLAGVSQTVRNFKNIAQSNLSKQKNINRFEKPDRLKEAKFKFTNEEAKET